MLQLLTHFVTSTKQFVNGLQDALGLRNAALQTTDFDTRFTKCVDTATDFVTPFTKCDPVFKIL